jgi:hypothetical protein
MITEDYDRLLNQLVDILIYDFSNKYQLLKNENLNKQRINNIMDDYQTVRNREFIKDLNKLKSIINN